jgi:hypothetical protein
MSYEEDLEKARAAAKYREAQRRYRAREIGDAEYLKARREYEESDRAFDRARGESSERFSEDATSKEYREFKERLAKEMADTRSWRNMSRKEWIKALSGPDNDAKKVYHLTDQQIAEAVHSTPLAGETRRGDVWITRSARYGVTMTPVGKDFPYYSIKPRNGSSLNDEFEVTENTEKDYHVVLKNVPKDYAERWTLHKADPKMKAPGKLTSRERLEFRRTYKPIVTDSLESVKEHSSPRQGFDLRNLESRPPLLWDSERAGVMADGYMLVLDKKVTDKVIGGYIEQRVREETKKNEKLGIDPAEAARLAKAWADKQRKDAEGKFPKFDNLTPTPEHEVRLLGIGRLGPEGDGQTVAYFSNGTTFVTVNADKISWTLDHLPKIDRFAIGKADKEMHASPIVAYEGNEAKAVIMPMSVQDVPDVIRKAAKPTPPWGTKDPGKGPDKDPGKDPDKPPKKGPDVVPGGNVGNYVTEYSRPLKYSLTEADAKSRIAPQPDGYTKIAQNMWSKTMENGGGHYATGVIVKLDDGKWESWIIPTDKNGRIKDVVMAERVLDVEDGDRQGHMRNVLVDIGVDAKTVVHDDNLAESYRWFVFPNESDVKEIDDARSKIVTLLSAHEAKQKTPVRLIISGGTEDQRQSLALAVKNNFTVRERKVLDHCLVTIIPDNGQYAGCFSGSADMSGKPLGVPKIIICSSYAKTSDVIIHEAIHALREFDPKRDYKFRAVRRYIGRDADLEESLTEAETVTRENPFAKDKSGAGYYHYIKIPEGWNNGPVNQGLEKGKTWHTTRADAHNLANRLQKECPITVTLTDADGKSRVGHMHNVRVVERWNAARGEQDGFFVEGNIDGDWTRLGDYKLSASLSRSTKDLIVEDRVIVTGPEKVLNGGVKGKRAQKVLTLKYPAMNISRLKIKGAAEAIDTYWQTDNRKGDPTPPPGAKTKIQVYNPRATEATVEAQAKAITHEAEGGKVGEWKDGKLRIVSKGHENIMPGKTRSGIRERHGRANGNGKELGADVVQSGGRRHVRL